MSQINKSLTYADLKQGNEVCVALINAAWGATVAWLEDYSVINPHSGHATVFPGIRSRMKDGLVPGLETPPFHPGPAMGRIDRG